MPPTTSAVCMTPMQKPIFSGGDEDATSAIDAGTNPLAIPWNTLTRTISNGLRTQAPIK